MELKKGLTFVAVGFLLTLVNLNLNFNGRSVNVMPAFVGWILLLLANYKLGDYVNDRSYLKILAPIMVVMTSAIYVMEFVMPGKALTTMQSIVPFVSTLYTFFLCGALEKVAQDYKSPRGATLHLLKYMDLALVFVMNGLALLLLAIKSTKAVGVLAMVVLFLAIAALFVAIALVVALFRLRSDVSKQL
ncbi:MAG: hypothetical protein IJH91_02970 [Mogibacterium sp.]|nr:hypothetical protein [Mogibacterium sp.]